MEEKLKLPENETLRRQLEKVNNQLSVREERDREREKTHDQGNQNVENKALASGLLLSEAVNEISAFLCRTEQNMNNIIYSSRPITE